MTCKTCQHIASDHRYNRTFNTRGKCTNNEKGTECECKEYE